MEPDPDPTSPSPLLSPSVEARATELLATFVPPEPIQFREYHEEDEAEEDSPIDDPEMTTPNYLNIGGRRVELADSKQAVDDTTTAFYSREDRNNLDTNKLNDLFVKAVSTAQPKYDFININLNDPNVLIDTYNLGMAVAKTRVNHNRYDMHDVFSIIDPSNGYALTDLYKNYALLTEEEVAESNEWYQTMTSGNDKKWYRQNLKLTFEYFTNNVEEDLQSKVLETYLGYPIEQRGGPLFFKIMMGILQNNSDEAAQYLIKTVRNIKLTNYEGENVSKVVSQIRGATNRLKNLEDENGNSEMPPDFASDIIKIFRTSSVSEYNDLFSAFQHQIKISKVLKKSANLDALSIDTILKFAEEQYLVLVQSGLWTGVNNKATETTFIAKAGQTLQCFNCGGDHLLSECNKPKNDERIQTNRKLYEKNKRKSKGKAAKNKWGPPTAEEKKNNSRRMIDGKEYFFWYRTRRWIPVGNKASGNEANVAEADNAKTKEHTKDSEKKDETTPVPSVEEINEFRRNKDMMAQIATVTGLLSQFK